MKKTTTKKTDKSKSKGKDAKKMTKAELKKIKGGITPQQLWPWPNYD